MPAPNLTLQTLRREAALAEQVRDQARHVATVARSHEVWADATFKQALARYEAYMRAERDEAERRNDKSKEMP